MTTPESPWGPPPRDMLGHLLAGLALARTFPCRWDHDPDASPIRPLGGAYLVSTLDGITEAWNQHSLLRALGRYGSDGRAATLFADAVATACARVTAFRQRVTTVTDSQGGDDIDATMRALRAVFTWHVVNGHDSDGLNTLDLLATELAAYTREATP